MDIKKIQKIADQAKRLLDEHGDDIKKEWKQRAPGLKDDAAQLKTIAKGDGSLTDKAKAAFEAIKDAGKPAVANPGEEAPKE